jgi:hypothetical protein
LTAAGASVTLLPSVFWNAMQQSNQITLTSKAYEVEDFARSSTMQRLMPVDILLKVDRRLALVIEPTGDDKLLKLG